MNQKELEQHEKQAETPIYPRIYIIEWKSGFFTEYYHCHRTNRLKKKLSNSWHKSCSGRSSCSRTFLQSHQQGGLLLCGGHSE